MRARRVQVGFTLIELVVALAITGMLAVAGVVTFTTVLDSRERARDFAAASNAAAANRGILVAWLSSGRVAAEQGRGPAQGLLNLTDNDDQVTVVASASTPLNSGEAAIRLFIDRDEYTPEVGLVAEIQDLTALRMTRVQLDSAVMGLLIEYLDNTTGLWVPRSNGMPRNPRAVRMTLSAESPDTLPALMELPFVQPLIATTTVAAPATGGTTTGGATTGGAAAPPAGSTGRGRGGP